MATMATFQTNVPSQLPARLFSFFARYPPAKYSAKYTGITIPLTKKAAKAAAENRPSRYPQPINPTSSITPAAESSTETLAEPSETTPQTPSTSLSPNPFLPKKNWTTGKWSGAKIGLRQQAELVKLAKVYGVEDLLPPGRKSTAFKEERLLEHGLRIRGTGEGQKVKGHKWERTQGTRLEKRRQAMENMPALVREWESKGHGRGWKKYPKRNS